VIKGYNVTLEEDIVEEAKKIAKHSGGKLSPLINELLEKWVKENSGEMTDGSS